MKVRNVLWGTGLYAATIVFLYGRRNVTATAEQTERIPTIVVRERVAKGEKVKQVAEAFRKERLSKLGDIPEDTKAAFLKREWVR